MTTNYAAKIASLLATAESYAAQGNEDAAATYNAKASELQLKKQIDESDIRAEQNAATPVDELTAAYVRGLDKNAGYIKAKRDLLYGLAAIFNLKTVIAHDRSYVRMFGHQTDIEFVQQLFDSLVIQMSGAMEAEAYRGAGRSWRTSFAHGWVGRVTMRLRAARASQTEDVKAETPGAELVLASRKDKVETYFKDQFAGRKLGTSYKNRSIRDAHGYARGDAAGARADIGGTRLNQGTRKQLG